MPTNGKKILAREILLFFGAAALVLLCWGTILLWNFYCEKKSNLILLQIEDCEKKIDSLKMDTKSTEKLWNALVQGGYYKKSFSTFVLTYSNSKSQKELFDSLSQNQFYTKEFDSFKSQFFKTNYEKADSLISTIKEERKNLSNSLSIKHYETKTNKWLIIFSIAIFFMLYPARLIYFLIKWAIKNVKGES